MKSKVLICQSGWSGLVAARGWRSQMTSVELGTWRHSRGSPAGPHQVMQVGIWHIMDQSVGDAGLR